MGGVGKGGKRQQAAKTEERGQERVHEGSVGTLVPILRCALATRVAYRGGGRGVTKGRTMGSGRMERRTCGGVLEGSVGALVPVLCMALASRGTYRGGGLGFRV
jgi:hypothetical protein